MRLNLLTALIAAGTSLVASASTDYSVSEQIRLPEAHAITKSDPSVTIAILSSGVNAQMPGLTGTLSRNTLESGAGKDADGLDNDGNGYIDDVFGVDAVTGRTEYSDLPGLGAGTFEASVIASPTEGIAPDSRIIPVRVVDGAGSSCSAVIAEAIDYALSRRARIILLGVSGKLDRPELCEAIARAGEQGVLVVGAAGNQAQRIDANWLPAGCGASNLIVAAASGEESQLADFSNWSPEFVHLAAPGIQVPGLSLNGGKVKRSGTPVSAAITAGVAALVWSHRPELSVEQVKEALIRGSDTHESLAGKVLGTGRINAYRALTALP
jgi:subtilisin family serine protease